MIPDVCCTTDVYLHPFCLSVINQLIDQSIDKYWCMGFEIDTTRPHHRQFVSVDRRLHVFVDILVRQSMDEEVETYFTCKCTSIGTRLCLPDAPFRNQSRNQHIAMSVGMCPLSNQLIPLPLNNDTDVYGGNGVSVSESKLSALLGVLDVSPNDRVVWFQMRRKKHHKPPFFSTKKIGKIQPPAFQYPSVLQPIRIIQHHWELIRFK